MERVGVDWEEAVMDFIDFETLKIAEAGANMTFDALARFAKWVAANLSTSLPRRRSNAGLTVKIA